MKRSSLVIDSYAMMVHLENEPAAEQTTKYLNEAKKRNIILLMSRINWGEIIYTAFRSKGIQGTQDVLIAMEQLPIEIIEISKELTYEAALLKGRFPIAYADCFAAGLAKLNNCPVLTGDKEFKLLEKEIQIEWL